MKYWVILLQIIVLTFLLSLFMPWWAIAIAAAVGGFNAGSKRHWRNFHAGFLAIFLYWTGYAAIIMYSTGSPMPDRMAHVFSFSLNGTLIMLITGLVGGVLGGFASLTGGVFRRILTGK